MKLPLKLVDIKEHVSKRFSQQLLIHYSDTKASACVYVCVKLFMCVYVSPYMHAHTHTYVCI